MKSVKGAGSVNLRGKKSLTLRCGCCEAQNFKERELKREHLKQIKKEIANMS
jgi:hypothetical protein